MTFFSRYKSFIGYAAAMAVLLILMRWLELGLLVFRHSFEIYAAVIAMIFMALGIWLAVKLVKPKTETIVVEKEVPAAKEFVRNESEIAQRNISKRELEVLELMASGHSNQEIADRLFVSTNTIKSHAASLFEKLDAKRRTQAVENAKQLGLIP
jgi:NarL family two-component system response regulator LiaR